MKRVSILIIALAVTGMLFAACGGGGGGGGTNAQSSLDVTIYADSNFVDTNTTTQLPQYSEFNTLYQLFTNLGHNTDTFAGTSDSNFSGGLSGTDVFLMPELYVGDLDAAISDTARATIADFVDDGGVFIIFDAANAFPLLNSTFGFGMTRTSDTGTLSLDTTAAANSRFRYAPATIPSQDATSAAVLGDLPAAAVPLYTDGSGNAVVTMIPYGKGYIFLFGWDWFNAEPAGSVDDGWNAVLATAANIRRHMPDVQLVEAMNDSYRDDIIDKLFSTGQFSILSAFEAGGGTPSLADLQEFDVAFVSSDAQFASGTDLGDNVADYVDSGGGAVLAMFSYLPGNFGLGGRFLADNYFAIPAPINQAGGAPHSMGTVQKPSHPVMEQVTVFDGGNNSYRVDTTNVVSGATRIADWDDGTPLVAVRTINGTRRADLGFYPPSNDSSLGASAWASSTDGARLMGNALTLVSEMPDPYESGDTFPIDIDSGPAESCSVSSTINVSGGPAAVRKVTLDINIPHTWTDDLDIFLESPTGTTIEISTDNGSSGNNYTNTIFSDAAINSITTGTAPFLGIYQPEVALSTVSGESADGTWTLHIIDDVCGVDGGTLEEWRLIVR